MNRVGYVEEGFRRDVIDKAVKDLRRYSKKFDVIAVRGVSGMLLGPILAYRLKKQLLVVRKPKETRHTSNILENWPDGPFRYIIVDDFIASGETVGTIMENIANETQGTFAGIYLYNRGHGGWHNPKKFVEECVKYSSNEFLKTYSQSFLKPLAVTT